MLDHTALTPFIAVGGSALSAVVAFQVIGIMGGIVALAMRRRIFTLPQRSTPHETVAVGREALAAA